MMRQEGDLRERSERLPFGVPLIWAFDQLGRRWGGALAQHICKGQHPHRYRDTSEREQHPVGLGREISRIGYAHGDEDRPLLLRRRRFA
jgi:hypothetical protein